ncbi:TlpA family protein disulfide reductase [Microbispora rosea]|uniref:TlpA family protein disulfide reductase n=1 Tax=Microbispora rosea TaxID=58117 RepID=UPI003423A236
MIALLWTLSVLSCTCALAALGVSLLVTRRYRELRALVTDGAARGPALPAPGTGIPPFTATTTEGARLDRADLDGPDRVVAFLKTGCEPCRDLLPELRGALEDLPAESPRPIVLVTGVAGERTGYVTALALVAHVVESDEPHALTGGLGVGAFPAVLVAGEGVVRRAGVGLAALDPRRPAALRR